MNSSIRRDSLDGDTMNLLGDKEYEINQFNDNFKQLLNEDLINV